MSTPQTLQRLKKRYRKDFLEAFSGRVLVLTSVIVFLVASSLVAMQAISDRVRMISDGQSRARTVATALNSHVEKIITSANSQLSSIVAQDILGKLATEDGRTEVTSLLRSHTTRQMFHFTVMDRAGRAIASSEGLDFIGTDLSAQGNYTALSKQPFLTYHFGRGTGRFGGGAGKDVFVISRPILDAANGFAGLIYTTIGVDDLINLFESLKFEGVHSARLMNAAGDTLLQIPARDLPLPKGERISVVASGSDVSVAVDLISAELLGAWRARYTVSIVAVIFLGATIASLTAFAVIIQRRREVAAETATLQVERLALASVTLGKLEGEAILLQYACDAAREIVGCQRAVITLRTGSGVELVNAISPPGPFLGAAVGAELPWCAPPRAEVAVQEAAAADRLNERNIQSPLPAGLRNRLRVPIARQDEAYFGAIEVLEKANGDFTADDHALCVQLAQLVSGALTKLRLIEAERQSRNDALQALDAERRAREEIERILSSISDGFVTFDAEWRFTYMNRAAEQITGKSRAEVLGRAFWEIFPHARHNSTWGEFHEAKRTNKARSYESFNPQMGKWLGVRVFPNPTGLSVFFRDETERRRKDLQLQQAQRMETVGQLTGGIAHDFNNLLTVVIGNADNLLDLIGPESELRENLELIRIAGRRGAELTQRLLAFARRQTLEPAVVAIGDVLTDMPGLIQRAVGEAVEVKLSHTPELWHALVDPVQLETALLNLSLNARDAMLSGGTLTIEADNVSFDETQAAEQGDVKPGDYVMIAVSDTGVGMSPEVLARAFDPFFTTKPVGKGTGLGLSMVYGLVKQSGGHIRLLSTVGQGTTVTLYLPRAPHHSPAAGHRGSFDGPTPKGNEVILFVEDNELVAQYTQSQLQELGYRIVHAANAADAVEMVQSGLRPDLLLTDIVLPGGVNGRQLAERLISEGYVARVLYTSGYSENAVVHDGRLDPGIVLLNKPFGRHDLALKVREALSLAMH